MAVFTGYNFYIMKNFSLIVVGILFIYCVSSCRKQVDKGCEMTVDLSISNPYLPMSVLVDTIESVRLQLPSPYFWGMVDNVISKDSCYYISDRKQEMAFRFDKSGTFLNTIGQRGEGPGEYREMDSFFVGKDCVYVCDMGKRTIYSYSFDGKFLHSLSFPYSLVFNDVVELPRRQKQRERQLSDFIPEIHVFTVQSVSRWIFWMKRGFLMCILLGIHCVLKRMEP